jgi:hypothetical protein
MRAKTGTIRFIKSLHFLPNKPYLVNQPPAVDSQASAAKLFGHAISF